MDSRLLDLLLRYEELAEQGQAVNLEELCRDCPDLREQLQEHLRHLGDINACLGVATVPTTVDCQTPGGSPAAAEDAAASLTAAGPRYSQLTFHAQGGLGKVFRAHDEELHREVALKGMVPGLDRDAEARRRFLQEAEITARLEHPGVVPVHGLVRDPDGRPFYAMRFIRGESLKAALDRFHQADGPGRDAGERNLAFRQLLGRFVEVCNTIAYAHSRGVLHRDLKPHNVMLGSYGETLVVDWGLAKPVSRTEEQRQATAEETLRPSSHSGEQTQMGQAMGTPAFVSPEQAAGRWNVVGPASDVYGLGAILYALLTGSAPVRGRDAYEILAKVQRGDFPRPRQVKASVPAALEAICLKAMALEPEKRHGSAQELAADVERWLADEPGSWHESWGTRARRWLRRRRTLVTSVSLALVVAVLVLSGATLLLGKAWEREKAAASEARENAEKARDSADQARQARDVALEQQRLRRLDLYLHQHQPGRQVWRTGDRLRLSELLRATTPGPGEEDLRGFEWHYLDRLSRTRGLKTLRAHAGRITSLAYSPDGKYLASAGQDGVVSLRDAASLAERLCLPVSHEPNGKLGVFFHEDSSKVRQIWLGGAADLDGRLKAGDTILRVQDAKGQWRDTQGLKLPQLIELLAGPPGSKATLEVMPAVGRGPRTCAITRRIPIGIQPGAAISTRGSLQPTDTLLAFQQDTSRLIVACPESAKGVAGTAISLWDVSTGREIQTFHYSHPVSALAVSRDGKTLAAAGGNGLDASEVRLWSLEDGRVLQTVPFEHTINSLAFSPDGQVLAAGLALKVFLVQPRSGRTRTLSAEGLIRCVAYSPDGKTLAGLTQKGDLYLWDTATGSLRAARKAHDTEMAYTLTFSSDGKYLATADDKFIKVWDAVTGYEICTHRGLPAAVFALAFSPDNRVLTSGDGKGNVVLWDPLDDHEQEKIPGLGRDIQQLAFTPGGTLIVGGGSLNSLRFPANAVPLPGTLQEWDVRKNRHLGTFQEPLPTIGDLAFSPGGRWLAVWENCNNYNGPLRLRLWDRTTGQGRVLLENKRGRISGVLKFSPDGGTLALSLGEIHPGARRAAQPGPDPEPGDLGLWDLAQQRFRGLLKGEQSGPVALAYSPDGKVLATAVAHGRVVHLREPTTGEMQCTLQLADAEADVTDLAFSPDGKTLAVARGAISLPRRPAALELWDIATRQRRFRLLSPGGGLTAETQFSSDGRMVAAGAWDGTVSLWDVQSGKSVAVLEGRGRPVFGLTFTRDRQRLYVQSVESPFDHKSSQLHVKCWDWATGKESPGIAGLPDSAYRFWFSPDLKELAVTSRHGGLALWQLEPPDQEEKQLAKLRLPLQTLETFPGHREAILCLAVSPDGKTLATGSSDATIKLWDLPGRRVRATLRGHVGSVGCLAFSPDGALLASSNGGKRRLILISDKHPGEIKLWNVAEGRLEADLPTQSREVTALAFSPNGLLASALDWRPPKEMFAEIRLWDVSRKAVQKTLQSRPPARDAGDRLLTTLALAFSPDGRYLATASLATEMTA